MKDAATDPLRDLVARYLVGGDEEALEAFVRATKPRLLVVAGRIGAPQDAEDAVQSAYLSLLRLRGEGLDAPPLPWLVTAVVRIAYRRKAVNRRQETIAHRLARARESPLPVDLALSGEREEALKVAVARLPEDFRDAVVLHHLEGLSVAEVAALLDVPEATVRTRLHRGRRLLESRFPRALLFGLALPWFLTDRAWASSAGGLLVTKKTTALAAVLLVALAGGLVALRPWESREADDAPPREETLVATTTPGETADAAPTAPVLAGDRANATGSTRDDARDGAFRGRIVDPSGRPVPGVTVEVRRLLRHVENTGDVIVAHAPHPGPPHAIVVGDAEGRFRFRPTDRGADATSAWIHVVAAGWPRKEAPLPRGEDVTVPLEPGASVRFRVTALGRPVESARVTLGGSYPGRPPRLPTSGEAFDQATTDEQGAATFVLSAGAYVALVEAEGRAPAASETLTLAAGDARDMDIALTAGTTLAMRVVDPEGRPVEGADVVAGGPLGVVRRGRTNTEGRTTLANFAPPSERADDPWHAHVFWRVLAPGFAPAQESRATPPSDAEIAIDVRLQRGHPARLRFVDGNGAPLAGVHATLAMEAHSPNPIRDPGPAFVSDEGGRMVVPHLTPSWNRSWRLDVAGREGVYARAHVHVDVGAGPEAPAEQIVVLRRNDGTLAGTVLDPDGRPVTKGRVGWRPADAPTPQAVSSAALDAEGRFEVQRIAVSSGWALLFADGWAPQEVAVDAAALRSGRPTTFSLRALGTVGGTVVTRDGKPFPDTPVVLHREFRHPKEGWQSMEQVGSTRTDAEGRFMFRGVGEEKYAISAQADGWLPAMPQPSEFRPGNLSLRLVLKPSSEGHGMPVVLRATSVGRPYDGDLHLQWKVKDRSWGAAPPERGPDGRYVFRVHGEPGTYDFEAHAPGHRPYALRGVRVEDRADGPVHDVALDRGAVLRLRLTDATGALRRGEWLTISNERVRADDAGEVEVGGFLPGPQALIRVALATDPEYTVAMLRDVSIPATLDVTLRRVGFVLVEVLVGDGGLTTDGRLRLLAADGRVVDETLLEAAKSKGRTKVSWWFPVADAGTYRVEATIGAVTREATAEAAPGTRSPLVSLDFR